MSPEAFLVAQGKADRLPQDQWPRTQEASSKGGARRAAEPQDSSATTGMTAAPVPSPHSLVHNLVTLTELQE